MKKSTEILILLFLLQPIFSFAISNDELIEAALERTQHQVAYDGRYYAIEYPGGDVPEDVLQRLYTISDLARNWRACYSGIQSLAITGICRRKLENP